MNNEHAKDDDNVFSNDGLRQRAEERMHAKIASLAQPRSDEEIQRLVHELEVHQIELELQNAELRHARDESERALEQYTDLYDFAPVGYVTLDRQGKVIEANLTAGSLLGIVRSKLIGSLLGTLVSRKTHIDFGAFLRTVFTSLTKEMIEVEFEKNGDTFIYAQVEAIARSSGEECRVALIDISARRQLEKKLEILNNELAAHAAQLESLNLELEAFNYTVSHDLRKPLAVINSYCQVIQSMNNSNLDEHVRGYVQSMYDSTLRMSQLIDSLLKFSLCTHVEMVIESVNLSEIASAVLADLRALEPERRVTIRITDGIIVSGDAALLTVVMDNLLTNAWKYSAVREETVIEFGVKVHEARRAWYVRDNGPGFDMQKAETLFKPFVRLPGQKVQGHGIGLSSVERIVKRHGGEVWAESIVGDGATFYFTLAETTKSYPAVVMFENRLVP